MPQNAAAGRQPERSAQLPVGRELHGLDRQGGVAGVNHDGLTGRREPGAVAPPLEHHDPKCVFGLTHGMAQGGLGEAQPRRSLTETPGVGHGQQRRQRGTQQGREFVRPGRRGVHVVNLS